MMRFDEVLEAIERMPPEDQETLVTLVQRRWLARRREALAKDVEEARQDFRAGKTQPRTPSELMGDILE